ncbi:MAG: hypothetical protein ACI8XO_003232, partial [Verrucomicrobiales bacterium]
DYDRLSQGAILRLSKLGNIVENPELPIMVELPESNETISLTHDLTDRQRRSVLAGGLLNINQGGNDVKKYQ